MEYRNRGDKLEGSRDYQSNGDIRGTGVRCLGDKARGTRLRWFGHVQRRNSGEIHKDTEVETAGLEAYKGPRRRFMNVSTGRTRRRCNRSMEMSF